MDFHLWHTQRQGWLTRGGITSTDLKEAETYSLDQAIGMCQKHMLLSALNVVPVPVGMLELILDKRNL